MKSCPKAFARLERGSTCYLWIVDSCPICGKHHQHGGGPFSGDPRKLLSHRTARCALPLAQRAGGYVLVEETEVAA